jgi:hypothetical protein
MQHGLRSNERSHAERGSHQESPAVVNRQFHLWSCKGSSLSPLECSNSVIKLGPAVVAHASALHEPASPVVGVRHASGSCLGEGLHGFCGMVFGKGLRYYPSLPVAFSDWRAAPS